MRDGERGKIGCGLRAARQRAGLSQSQLAARAGTTRQTIGALEAGLYPPTMNVALRLARALGREIGELFWLEDDRPTVAAELLVGATGATGPLRVQVARVGTRTIARPATAYGLADGLAAPSATRSGADSVTVELLTDPARLDRTAVVAGCDPALGALGAHVTRRHPDLRVLPAQAGSLAALTALQRGEAHVAGMHLLDAASGDYNVPFVRRQFAGRRVTIVTVTHWAQGLIVAAGNPRGIAGVADLARPDLTMVNREPGSGSRATLDQALAAAGVAPATLRGYDRSVGSHGTVAAIVAAGLADAGPGIQAAADALGLGFVPLGYERYDLIVPAEHRETPTVQALLDTLASRAFRDELETLPGYDTSRTGTVVLEQLLPARDEERDGTGGTGWN